MTNRAALFARSIQCFSLTVMVMMSSMNPSIDASVARIYTARKCNFSRWFSECCLSSFGSKVLCGELRFSVSQHSSLSRLFPRYISTSLIVVYSDGAGVVPKVNRRQIKAILFTIVMQVDNVVAFA